MRLESCGESSVSMSISAVAPMAEQGSEELRAKRQVFYPQLTASVSLGQSREDVTASRCSTICCLTRKRNTRFSTLLQTSGSGTRLAKYSSITPSHCKKSRRFRRVRRIPIDHPNRICEGSVVVTNRPVNLNFNLTTYVTLKVLI